MCAVAFHTTHGQNSKHKCDTEFFAPVASLNYMFASPSFLIRSLVGSTGKYDLLYKLMQN